MLAVLLGVAEMFSLDLILIMLAVGRTCRDGRWRSLDLPVAVQLLAAAGTSIAMLAAGAPRPGQEAARAVPSSQLGHGKLVGKQGLVTEPIQSAHAPAESGSAGRSGPLSPTTRP